MLALSLLANPSLLGSDATNYIRGGLIELNDNGAWSWFMDERVIVDRGRLIVGSVRAPGRFADTSLPGWGDIELNTLEIETGKTRVVKLHEHFEQDDHNAPGLFVLPDGRYFAAYSKHNQEPRIFYRFSTRPGDPFEWGPPTEFITPGMKGNWSGDNATYCNPIRLAAEHGRIYLFHRGVNQDPNYLVSDDNAASWRYGGRLFIGRRGYSPYTKYASNGRDTIHFVGTENHPRNFDNSLYHGFVRSGNVYLSDGTLAAPLATSSNTTVQVWNLTRIYQGGPTNVAWMTDIHLDRNERPVVLFTIQVDGAGLPRGQGGMDHRFCYARWDGTRWLTQEIAFAGRRLYPGEDDYTGLGAIDPQNTDIVYISTDADPITGAPLISRSDHKRHREIFRGSTRDGGQHWQWTPITENSTMDNLRPLVPIWNDPRTALVWMRGSYSNNRGEWTTKVAATILKPEESKSIVRVVDLNVNETAEVTLANGAIVRVKLLNLEEKRDSLRQAVRKAEVTVEIDGRPVTLTSATYHLPVTVGPVQIDCPITKGYVGNSSEGNAWGLLKDARLRLWPAGSPWIEPGSFIYPLKQRWFASHTQMANEPTFVDGGEVPSAKKIYYHYGLDFGGAEAMVDVVAATAGRVISAGKEILPGYTDSPVQPRYDVVYLLDDRGWYYRYSHLFAIDPAIRPGAEIQLGQKVGVLGKEGGSGGWSHLHFDITSRQPSGLWGIQEGYAFVWQAYQREYSPKIIAVARPHQFISPGETVTLDGTKSWSANGPLRYSWKFTDGSTATGPTAQRTYSTPGEYSEILKVTDARGQVDYDFAVVVVAGKGADELPPTIHATYVPTKNLRVGEPATFKVRTFRTTAGHETWDFGDGTPTVVVKSDGNVKSLAKDGYAIIEHRFARPGDYIVRVERTNEHGYTATARLHVPVE